MTFIDSKNLHKLPPEQRKQFEELLKAYPQVNMNSKMETARELNTPAAQEMKKSLRPSIQTSIAEDELDLSDVHEQQEAQRQASSTSPKVLGEMRVDPAQSNYQSIRETDKAEEAYRRREDLATPARKTEEEPKKKTTKFSPIGKKHPVMLKMRQSLGLDDLEKAVPVVVSGVEYELHRLNRSDIIKASALASMRSNDDVQLKSNIESALIAYGIKKIDKVPVEDVFEVPYREVKYATGREEELAPPERQSKGHQLLFEFLIDSPTELTEILVVHYEQNFQPLSLLADEQTMALCPEANCRHRAIIAKDDNRFCPYHGSELKKESQLPNPS